MLDIANDPIGLLLVDEQLNVGEAFRFRAETRRLMAWVVQRPLGDLLEMSGRDALKSCLAVCLPMIEVVLGRRRGQNTGFFVSALIGVIMKAIYSVQDVYAQIYRCAATHTHTHTHAFASAGGTCYPQVGR